ncbi:MAG: hypothetical protein NVSMB62_16190 [Acidobacteriaceae bacterium]
MLEQIKAHDIVLLQLGQNDVFELNDQNARSTIPGIGPKTQEIENLATHKHEIVHTYGWYLRSYVKDVHAKGAIPVVMSLTARNVWKDGQVEVGVNNYREWAYRVAMSEGHSDFVDASEIIAADGVPSPLPASPKTCRRYEKRSNSTEEKLVRTTYPGATTCRRGCRRFRLIRAAQSGWYPSWGVTETMSTKPYPHWKRGAVRGPPLTVL